MMHPFWSYGFRPFFLLAGLFAAAAIPLWVLLYTGDAQLTLTGGPLVWHVHEMLFAFGAAAIAGFLTTAVPNWTATPPLAGGPVAALAALWLVGRAAWLGSGTLPGWLVAAADLVFLPTLILSLAPMLVRARQWRSLPIILLIVAFWLGALQHHLFLMTGWAAGFGHGTTTAIVAIVALITIIGGRIVPAFTRNALAAAGAQPGIRSYDLLDSASIISVVAAGAALVFVDEPNVVGGLALAAALLNIVRLAGWQGHRTLAMPIVWILHVAYLWIPVGFALLAASQWSNAILPSAGFHALTVGAVATMIMAVATRAALGHTGRPLTATGPIVAAYVLVCGAAVTRVAAALIGPGPTTLLYLSAGLWFAAFAIFSVVYYPILTGPRADAAVQTRSN